MWPVFVFVFVAIVLSPVNSKPLSWKINLLPVKREKQSKEEGGYTESGGGWGGIGWG